MLWGNPLDNLPISSENRVYWVIFLVAIFFFVLNWWEKGGYLISTFPKVCFYLFSKPCHYNSIKNKKNNAKKKETDYAAS